MSKVEEWLSEFSKPNTQRNYKVRLYKFFDATGLNEHRLMNMSPEEIRHELMVYRTNQLTKGDKQNSVLTVINSVRSFLVQIDKPIKFRRGALGKGQADTDSHIFSNGDLKKLYDVGNTQEKALIATASSLGWEISAFLDLDRAKVASFIAHAKDNGEKFIFRDDIRDKNGEPRLAIFNPLAIEALTTYLETAQNTAEKLFPYTSDGVQKMLNRLAKDSGLKTTGSIRFHNIRKWLMSRLSRCGFGDFQIKYILGKAIPVSDRTYLQDLKSQVEEKYPIVYEDYLNISPKPKNEKISDNEEFKKLKEDQLKDKQTIEELQNQIKGILETTKAFDELEPAILKDLFKLHKDLKGLGAFNDLFKLRKMLNELKGQDSEENNALSLFTDKESPFYDEETSQEEEITPKKKEHSEPLENNKE